MKRSPKQLIPLFIFLLLFNLQCFSQRKAFESYYLHTSDYPRIDASPSWGEGGREVQGITHDDKFWYITAVEKFYDLNLANKILNFLKNYLNPFGIFIDDLENYQNCYLWKIPVSEPLDQDFTNNSKVTQKMLLQFTQLSNVKNFTGYVHWGDLDYYYYDTTKTGYLIVPSTSNNANPSPAVIIFRASDLSLVGFGKLPGGQLPGQPKHTQENIGWCAVDSAGFIFTSNDDPDTPKPSSSINGTSLFKYKFDWWKIKKGYNGNISSYIQFEESHTLKGPLRRFSDGTTTNLLDLHNMQGGEFSPSNELLYISNGSGHCYKGLGFHPTDGIHVIDTKTWTEIERSTNAFNEIQETNYFEYTYDFGCGFFEVDSHSPEGLTIWDLDNIYAPHGKGQLHVLVADVSGLPANKAGLVHFTGKLQVDQSLKEPATLLKPISGTNERPFFTVSDAFNFYPGWDGARIVVKNGTYGDIGHYSTRVKISSSGGSAVIGKSNPTIQGVVLYQHPNYKGDYRYFDKDVPDLDLGTINFADVTSSFRLYNIKEIIFYDGNNYTGASLVVTKDNLDVTIIGWNDRIGSLKIIR